MQFDKVTAACTTYLQQIEGTLTYGSLAEFHLHTAQMWATLNQRDRRDMHYNKLAKLPWNSTTLQCLSKLVKELLPNNKALCRDILHTPGRGAACELQVRQRKAPCWLTQSIKSQP